VGLEPAQLVKTLAHELAHAILHSEADCAGLTRAVAELEAESVARAGLAEILAVNLGPAMKPIAKQWLIRLFDDENAKVQEAAAKAFWRIDAAALPALEDVCLAFIASRAFEQHAGDLMRALERAPGNSPSVVRTLAERFLAVAGDRAGDIRYREAAEVEDLSSLLLQAYAQTDSEDERSLLLDQIDGMLRVNAYAYGRFVGEWAGEWHLVKAPTTAS